MSGMHRVSIFALTVGFVVIITLLLWMLFIQWLSERAKQKQKARRRESQRALVRDHGGCGIDPVPGDSMQRAEGRS
ncbi:ABC-type transport system involved in cytochrome bd biosynthesis fused ATPase/permease subunit [Nitrobacter vulgaris]|nr:ABC-type transport system involved in cytochrome bd biosynthesis fused ATPase/permease subunit [Nitrobacter vulgaris]